MQGPLRTGTGEAGQFVGYVADTLGEALGFDPFHGTLNVELSPPEPSVRLDGLGDDHCDGVDLSPCRVWGVRAAVLRPLVPEYPDRKTEVVAPVHLRSLFGLEAGDRVELTVDGPAWPSESHPIAPASLDSFEAVVLGVPERGVPDALWNLDCPVALWTGEGSSADESPPAADAVVDTGDGSRADQLEACFDRLGVTPGNSVVVCGTRAEAEAAGAVGASVLRPEWR